MPASPSSFQNRRMSSQSVVASPARQPSPSFEEDDLILIRLVVAKDRQAFEILYQRYAPRLHRYLSNLIRQRELIEEVLDDVMLVVWQNAAHFNQTSRISTWMFGIAYHKALKAFVRPANQSREVPPAMPDQGSDREGPERAMARQELHRTLSCVLETLSPELWTVVELTFYHGYSYQEIAEITGCPMNTVKTRMFHARQTTGTGLGRSGAAPSTGMTGGAWMTPHEANARNNRFHQEVCERLPWYVDGRLEGREREAVEMHLSTCPVCQAELGHCRDLAAAVQTTEATTCSPSPEHFSRLMARIDAAEAHASQNGGWRERLRAQCARHLQALQTTPGLVRWALAAQGVMILLLVGVLVWQAPFSPEPLYRTLADDGEQTRQDQAHLQVVFADEMTAQELRALLSSIGGTIVKGPSALGVYTVEIPVSEGSPDLVNPILDAERAHPKVRLAEPIPSR
jgi:RNA polymerase sigma factor (sigma-70 family)